MSEIGRTESQPEFADRFHRREVIAAGIAGMAGLVLPASMAAGKVWTARAGDEAARPARTARNCVFMVSDGMSFGTLSLGHLWIKRREGRESRWAGLWGRAGVRRSVQQTHALDSLVTDSAAGSSAWGSGVHVNNGAINVLPEGRQLMPIGVRAMQGGKRLGLVTTTRVTHATPAGFIGNVPRRDMEGLLARQMLERGFDVALGGGAKFFPEAVLGPHTGVRVVRDRAGMMDAPADGGRLLGLFADSHVPFEIERPETVPRLSEMATKALDMLGRPGGDGFLLQIEGGRVDHAAHNNDAGALVREQAEFDAALGVVLGWLEGRDDTLLVVTTDHGNANPGLTLYGKAGEEGFDRLGQTRQSFDWVFDQLQPFKSWQERAERAPALVQRATGIELDAEETRLLGLALAETRVSPFAAASKWTSVLGAILADHFGVAFLSPNHTADLTELTAIGPGSELIPAYVDNIEMNGVMARAMGLPEGKMLPGMEEPMTVPSMPKPD